MAGFEWLLAETLVKKTPQIRESKRALVSNGSARAAVSRADRMGPWRLPEQIMNNSNSRK